MRPARLDGAGPTFRCAPAPLLLRDVRWSVCRIGYAAARRCFMEINMSQRLRMQVTRRPKTFFPEVGRLESRFVPSAGGSIALARAQASSHGVAIQTGTLLGVTVNKPGKNSVFVAYDGIGNAQVSWNVGHVHAFSGVGTVDVHSQGARKDKFTFDLVGRASPALAVGGVGNHTESALRHDGARVRVRAQSRTPSPNQGNATQSGVVLTVDVDDRKGNFVQISDAGAGNIQVAWNSGPARAFAGVSTIVVHATMARNDSIIFTGPFG
jgi:hypothetical protein